MRISQRRGGVLPSDCYPNLCKNIYFWIAVKPISFAYAGVDERGDARNFAGRARSRRVEHTVGGG